MTNPAIEAAESTVRPEERRLVALDLDGTVLLEDDTLSPGVVDAVRSAESLGHIVTIATGRSWESVGYVLEKLGLSPRHIVTANGATIMTRDDMAPSGYRRDFVETFDATDVLTLIEQHLPDGNYLVELADGSRLFNNRLDDWNLRGPNARQVDIEEMKGHEVTRVVVVSDDHGGTSFAEFVDKMGLQQVSYSVGWSAWLDIAPQGVDKSTALEHVRELEEISPGNVVVMGDGRNDIQMLDWARESGGEAVVMGQALPEVAVHGSRITASVELGGVAQALDEIGLTAS
ncbi:MAG: HAD family hydrolase [Microbacterium gubbeenense]|uniref:HAD family hydrolase n=1 Tax=Microbacterium gubbeenense TaxID=159896 RepID=UPI003F995C47